MLASPKLRRNFSRILPFGFIWGLVSLVFIVNDLSLNRNQSIDTDVDIRFTLPVLVFAVFASVTVGLVVGVFEMVVLEKRFRNFSLVNTILLKIGIYLSVLLVVILIAYPLAAGIESQESLMSESLWLKFYRFIGSLAFWNTIFQLGFMLFLSVIYSAVSENMGHSVLRNLVLGRYHKPTIEKRIFMFLDMKDSTRIAEQLAHVLYFELLSDYYDVMAEAIVKYHGEVYQYIGDEVVITWRSAAGIENENCLNCFFAIRENLKREKELFLNKYGILPRFKAGMHIGEVTTGELGALKREIVYTGDVLNTAARLQGRCNTYQKNCLISGDLLRMLPEASAFKIEHQGNEVLKGKEGLTTIFSVETR